MDLDSLILGRACPSDGFPHAVARHIRGRIAIARESAGLFPKTFGAERHIADLTRLADYVAGLSLADQRLNSLYLLQAAAGRDLDADYAPGVAEAELLARVGGDRPASTDTSEVLNEVVAAAVDDVTAGARATQSRLQDDLRLARRDAERVERAEENVRAAERECDRLAVEADALRAALEQATAQRDHFRSFVPRKGATRAKSKAAG